LEPVEGKISSNNKPKKKSTKSSIEIDWKNEGAPELLK